MRAGVLPNLVSTNICALNHDPENFVVANSWDSIVSPQPTATCAPNGQRTILMNVETYLFRDEEGTFLNNSSGQE